MVSGEDLKTDHANASSVVYIGASRIPTCGSHEDIDQFLSRIATELQMRDAITVDELVDAISDSFPNTEVEEVKAMLDVKEFLGNAAAADPSQHARRVYDAVAVRKETCRTTTLSARSWNGAGLPYNPPFHTTWRMS
ncbi:Hypp6242 [Branchiostoma lanceolatum]|uniref:Hypp6242 protein n=1 Tax=Branchiostoma lanceolatum TaxID=7740 RepID=A0A8J9YNT1_BRALA|nr:Hypp6242 [Branchiostoma lanceolatum]